MSTLIENTSAMLQNYPSKWSAFIGQEPVKRQLMTAAKSARMRKTRMPHTLLGSGAPGIGKTSLAVLIGWEMRGTIQVVSGKVTQDDARLALSKMEDGGVLIMDEFHQMVQGGKASAEWLLHYMHDGVLMTPRGPEPQPNVTIVAATTEPGVLPNPILDRFLLRPVLLPYTDEEAAKIAGLMAKQLFEAPLHVPSKANLQQIARAGSNNPRVMKSILSALRDIALVERGANHDGRQYDVAGALEWLGLTEDGLTRTCRDYMLVLLHDFGGQPAGSAALRDRLQEPGGLGQTERLLMEKNLLGKSPKGRYLTSVGLRRARLLDAA